MPFGTKIIKPSDELFAKMLDRTDPSTYCVVLRSWDDEQAKKLGVILGQEGVVNVYNQQFERDGIMFMVYIFQLLDGVDLTGWSVVEIDKRLRDLKKTRAGRGIVRYGDVKFIALRHELDETMEFYNANDYYTIARSMRLKSGAMAGVAYRSDQIIKKYPEHLREHIADTAREQLRMEEAARVAQAKLQAESERIASLREAEAKMMRPAKQIILADFTVQVEDKARQNLSTVVSGILRTGSPVKLRQHATVMRVSGPGETPVYTSGLLFVIPHNEKMDMSDEHVKKIDVTGRTGNIAEKMVFHTVMIGECDAPNVEKYCRYGFFVEYSEHHSHPAIQKVPGGLRYNHTKLWHFASETPALVDMLLDAFRGTQTLYSEAFEWANWYTPEEGFVIPVHDRSATEFLAFNKGRMGVFTNAHMFASFLTTLYETVVVAFNKDTLTGAVHQASYRLAFRVPKPNGGKPPVIGDYRFRIVRWSKNEQDHRYEILEEHRVRTDEDVSQRVAKVRTTTPPAQMYQNRPTDLDKTVAEKIGADVTKPGLGAQEERLDDMMMRLTAKINRVMAVAETKQFDRLSEHALRALTSRAFGLLDQVDKLMGDMDTLTKAQQ